MGLNKCAECNKEKEAYCCYDCYWKQVCIRISESMAVDVANQVAWKMEDRIQELEELIKSTFKDKQIVCIKRGGKLIKV